MGKKEKKFEKTGREWGRMAENSREWLKMGGKTPEKTHTIYAATAPL